MIHIVSMSGGKDSVAMWLWARRTQGGTILPVFADTGWEAAQTYAYLDDLERLVGPITRVKADSFDERTLRHNTFPSRVRKWCSPELKRAPMKAWLDTFRETTTEECDMLIGIRHEESAARATALEREWDKEYDLEVWRPLLHWTVQDVIAEHHRAGVPMNPLYHAGAERVGCWPCIHARKSEIRLISEIDPARIERVAELEAAVGQTMFAIEESRAGKPKDAPRHVIPTPIHEVVAWAKTSRGGKQLVVIPEASGCMRWGTCDAPRPVEDEEVEAAEDNAA